MTHVGVDFDEIRDIIERYRTMSVELDSALSQDAPAHVDAGEASDAVGTVLVALMDGAATLGLYGQGLADQSNAAVEDIEAFDIETASDLTSSLSILSRND